MTEREKKEMNKPDLKISDLSPATKKLKLSWDLNKQGGQYHKRFKIKNFFVNNMHTMHTILYLFFETNNVK